MATSPTTEHFEQEIAKINDFVQTAQRLIHQSTIVDISQLQEKMATLCAELEQAPPADAKAVLPKLENLFNSIERLENDLNMQHDAISEHFQATQEQGVNPLFAQEVSDDED
ncbi:hypothetical protein RYZ26_05735 [Terasakiella sp. A23]|uniref:hypothetical protein n=1 Tax=Terasakiella sp. FCG-A23 TaxID=3080561 RepID=UPI002952E6E0|nr:hypothetical protein [Terasakiella sp. A23]MDV7339083.1 hypothetical protein [Terasakiella sp. A23]